MKKTEKISLGGLAFIIEADAYSELEKYLNDIRECFRNDNTADEIVEDIEVRIAELLREKCRQDVAVNISMIREIMTRIGNPKELAGQDEEQIETSEDGTEHKSRRPFRDRRLYRNIDERVLGGVCSGLSQYFVIDKVFFRLAFLIAFFLGFFEAEDGLFSIAIFGYLILWIAMPAARTVEQKCEMSGSPIDLKGFRAKEGNIDREIKETISSPALQATGRVIRSVLGIVLVIIGLCGCFSTIFIPSIADIFNNNIALESLMNEKIIAGRIVCEPTFGWLIFSVMGLASIGMLYGGIMMCFDFKAPSWKPGLVIFIVWVISVFVLIGWVLNKVAELLPMMI